jgi:hypothetical protein
VNPALDIAIIALGANGLAGYATAVYVVRRVSPWPKPPVPGAASSRGRPGAGQAAGGQAPAANGSDPARSTAVTP